LKKEQVSGHSQVKLVTTLAHRPASDPLEDVISKLKQIQQFALAGKLRVSITCDSGSVSSNSKALSDFTSSLPRDSVLFPVRQPPRFARDIKSFYPLPYQVYYGALALPTVSYTSPQGAPLQMLSQLLTHKHLHHEIREKGGAYGGGAYSRALDGVFGFYSYRDPNPLNTIKIMTNAGRWAVDKQWSDRDLEDAKISVFQGVDAPRSVNEEGMSNFLYGITEEMRQTRREQLLDVTKDQVREVAQKFIVDGLSKNSERLVFLGEKRDWVDKSWTVHEMDIHGVE
jgi:Zn-dependent M16 (insulinase) family peptidase